MYATAKAVHLVGLAMFLGSILGHITIGFVPGAKEQAQAMLLGRQAIDIATWTLTIPGLTLLVLTGLLMARCGRLRFAGNRWLTLHALLAVLIVLNAVAVLMPTGGRLLEVSAAIPRDPEARTTFAVLAARESMFGALNLTLTLVTVLIAAMKPRLDLRRTRG
jgi:hypothetical protein